MNTEPLHNIENLVITTNKDGVIINSTIAFDHLLNTIKNGIKNGYTIQEWVHPEDKSIVQTTLQNIVEEPKPTILDIRLKVDTDRYEWFEMKYFYFKDELNTESIVISFYSIDERKKELLSIQNLLNEEKHFNELKSKYVSTTSHELRTPVSIIRSSAEVMMLLLDSTKDEKLSNILGKYITSIVNESDRLTKLINDTLILQKTDADMIVCNKLLTDLVKLIENTIERHNLIQKDGRIMQLVIVGEPYKVNIDPTLFEYIIDNLFSNAFKYSNNTPNPICTIHFNTDKVSVSVKDFGIGIPEEELDKLFVLFFRANNVGTIKGTGLGLNFVKKLIEIHDGTIQVLSKQNIETEFIVSFLSPNN